MAMEDITNVVDGAEALGNEHKVSFSRRDGGKTRKAKQAACRKAYRERRNREIQETCIDELLAVGAYCSVSKHARLGCAVVSFVSEAVQADVMTYLHLHGHGDGVVTTAIFGNPTVTVKLHRDKASQEYDRKSLFIHWGHSVEKSTPLSVKLIMEKLDLISHSIALSQSRRSLAPAPERVPCTCLLSSRGGESEPQLLQPR
eukprot:TRINITY_DN63843_c0_g1_i1.p1 TRINITY_DN63843_c0_g1~~TRINITY_DN63843_c0_g1_i1.p1  ORF type:complete len:201 (+),score=37.79 TRINITY_DN63843_c0_g1_i1:73-675(+)